MKITIWGDEPAGHFSPALDLLHFDLSQALQLLLLLSCHGRHSKKENNIHIPLTRELQPFLVLVGDTSSNTCFSMSHSLVFGAVKLCPKKTS